MSPCRPAVSTEAQRAFSLQGAGRMAVRYDYRTCACGRVYAVQIDDEGEPITPRDACHVCAPPTAESAYIERRRDLMRVWGRKPQPATVEST